MKKLTQKDFMQINIFNIEKSIERSSEKHDVNELTTKSKGNIVWMRYCLPYKAVRLDNGQMLFLSRSYQPLFMFSEGTDETLPKDCTIDLNECRDFAFDSDLEEKVFYDYESVPWDSLDNLKKYIEELKPYLV
jgi:hypothetical protein